MIAIYADLRTRLQPVRHQGRRQSCLAFATSTAHEHKAGIAEHLSVEYLFYCSVERTPGKNPTDGTTMAAAAGALADEGQPIEAAWPTLQVADAAVERWVELRVRVMMRLAALAEGTPASDASPPSR